MKSISVFNLANKGKFQSLQSINSFIYGIYIHCIRVLLIFLGLFGLAANPVPFTWLDGDRQQVIYLNPSLVAELKSSTNSKLDKNPRILHVRDTKIKNSIPKDGIPKQNKETYSEVFEENVGGRKMALPGDIFVEFDSTFTEDKVKQWAFLQNLTLLQKINSDKNIYRIKTNPGLESLTVANSLLTQVGVVSAFPNWWRESAPR